MSGAKQESVREWLLKAQADLDLARLAESGGPRYFAAAIFNCQQAAEKALKAFLTYRDRSFEKTHNLRALVLMAAEAEPSVTGLMNSAALLTPYATLYRYPGPAPEPSAEEFGGALATAESVYRFVLGLLPQSAWPER